MSKLPKAVGTGAAKPIADWMNEVANRLGMGDDTQDLAALLHLETVFLKLDEPLYMPATGQTPEEVTGVVCAWDTETKQWTPTSDDLHLDVWPNFLTGYAFEESVVMARYIRQAGLRFAFTGGVNFCRARLNAALSEGGNTTAVVQGNNKTITVYNHFGTGSTASGTVVGCAWSQPDAQWVGIVEKCS